MDDIIRCLGSARERKEKEVRNIGTNGYVFTIVIAVRWVQEGHYTVSFFLLKCVFENSHYNDSNNNNKNTEIHKKPKSLTT